MHFKKRIGITLAANIVRGVVTIGVAILLARFFNVADYGRFAFLTATFMALKQLLDLGTSSAFFTFLSQKKKPVNFLIHFWIFFFGKYALAAILIAYIFPDVFFERIWHGETRAMVILAMCATAMQFDFWPAAMQMPESQRRTLEIQSIYIGVLLLQLALVLTFYGLDILTLELYFISMSVLWLGATAKAVSLYKFDIRISENIRLWDEVRKYAAYCLPVAPLLLVGFVCDFYDRWLLQSVAGSSEQAYFSISQQLSAAVLLVTSALIRVFWKEIAEALHLGNESFAKLLYIKTKKRLYFFGVLIAAGIIPWADVIVVTVFGKGYEAAYPVVVIMMLSSIHQTVGQVEGSFILASGKTRIGMWSSIVMPLIGIAVTYLLVSPDLIFGAGLGLGAIGLAVKVLLIQVLSVNLLGYILSREFNMTFEWIYQIKVMLLLFAIGYVSKLGVSSLGFSPSESIILGLFSYVTVLFFVFYKVLKLDRFLGLNGN